MLRRWRRILVLMVLTCLGLAPSVWAGLSIPDPLRNLTGFALSH